MLFLIALHLHLQDENGNGLTDKEIQHEVDTFMFAGHDTTASAVSWMLYNMARNPEYQQKCRDEIDDLMDKKGKDEIEWYVSVLVATFTCSTCNLAGV